MSPWLISLGFELADRLSPVSTRWLGGPLVEQQIVWGKTRWGLFELAGQKLGHVLVGLNRLG